MSTLTLRNLTSTPLTLKVIDRYKSPEQLNTHDIHGSGISKFSRNFTSLFSSTTPAKPQPTPEGLASSAEKFVKSEVDIQIQPFTTCTTEIPPPVASRGEKVRLTFEGDDERYRIDIPSSQNESQTFNALSQHPKHEFTGVFLPQDAFLSIYSSAQLYCWMKNMKDETPLSALSIPGTHNSPTCHKALPSVRCQARSPKTQLENGIRFFDIRVQPESPQSSKLVLVHAVFPISLTGQRTFSELLTTIFAFLDANPSETLIMSVKREGVNNLSDEQTARILYDHYTNNSAQAHRWYSEPRIPTLGEARGKIILMRRLLIDEHLRSQHDGRGWAIDAECWQDNTANDLHGQVCVQDFYEVLEAVNIDKKIEYCQAHLERAAECVASLPGITCDPVNPTPPQPFYLNFLSASNFWRVGCWPERIASQVNPKMLRWMCKEHARDTVGDGGTGIVVLDWVGLNGDWDLVRCVVGMNAKLMMREMTLTENQS